MRLSAKNITDVVAHLSKFKKAPCPVCSCEQWNVSDTLFELPEYEFRAPWAKLPPPPPMPVVPFGNTTPLAELGKFQSLPSVLTTFAAPAPAPTPQVFPVIPVTCVTCGYVYLLSGIALNIVARST